MYRGRNVWLYIDTQEQQQETWKAVACTTSKSLNATTEEVDISSDCDQGEYANIVPGTRSWTVEATGWALRTQGIGSERTSYSFLFRMWRSGTVHQIRLASPNDTFFFQGPARVTDFSINAETPEFVSFDITLTGTGALIDEPEV